MSAGSIDPSRRTAYVPSQVGAAAGRSPLPEVRVWSLLPFLLRRSINANQGLDAGCAGIGYVRDDHPGVTGGIKI